MNDASGIVARSPWRHLAALVVLLVCAGLLHFGERGRTITADESSHLIRGHAIWWEQSARLSIAHPPLANAITSLPVAWDGDDPWKADDPEGPSKAEALRELPGWAVGNPLPLSKHYFRHDFIAAKIELGLGRHVMMLWTLVFAASLYVWCDRRWGFATGILALTLAVTCPTLLAHGQLVTTDMPATATTAWGLMALIAWVERPGWLRLFAFVPAVSAMVLVKHSGPLYVLVFAAILLICAQRGWAGFARADRRRWLRTSVTFVQLVVAAVLVGVAIAAAYGFDRVGLRVDELLALPEPQNWIARRRDHNVLDASLLRFLPDWLRLPFPYTWLLGVASVGEQNELGHGRYFFGIYGRAWHPLYFPVMLLIKTPLGTLVLLGLAGWIGWRRRKTLSSASAVLLAFFAVCLTLSIFSRINIGVRHALPLVPILIVFAARAGALIWTQVEARPTWLRTQARARALVIGCVLANVGGAAWTFPHWLGDFNLLVGGPWGGHYISIVGEDWGQDLGDVADELQRRGVTDIRYYTTFYMRTEELQHAGMTVKRVRCKQAHHGPEPLVLHRTDWIRQRKRCFEWLGDAEPDFVVNQHVLVFMQLPPVPAEPEVEPSDLPDESDDEGG
ncbi:ArnT family glycosyltransferase [Nannocystaceae bacterium ST9]